MGQGALFWSKFSKILPEVKSEKVFLELCLNMIFYAILAFLTQSYIKEFFSLSQKCLTKKKNFLAIFFKKKKSIRLNSIKHCKNLISKMDSLTHFHSQNVHLITVIV